MPFKPITIDDYRILKPYFDSQPYRLSVYSLLSIIVWSCQKYRASYAIADGALIIGNEAVGNPNDRYLVLPIGPADDESPEGLRDLAVKLDYPEYWFIPGDWLDRFERSRIEALFTISEQTEYEDYIYLTDDLSSLKGNRFAKKRNLIHQFHKLHGREDRVAVEAITPENADECLVFLERWCEEHEGCEGPDNESLACEKRALITALNHIEALEGRGILVRIDGTVSAFGLASRVNADMGVLNFEKAFSHIRGLYQFLDNECAKRLLDGFRFINKESDMGIADLAQSKKSYHPVERLKSYRLTLR